MHSQRRRLLFLGSLTFLLLLSLLWTFTGVVKRAHAATTDPDTSVSVVQATATVQTSPMQITVQWVADANATGYTVARKSLSDTSWGTAVSLPGTATSYTDTQVTDATGYEYKIVKSASSSANGFYSGYGYVYAGAHIAYPDSHGKLVLIVDNTYAADLAPDLAQLQQDLVGDGWQVLRHDVGRNDSITSVKALIEADYNADPTAVKAVFLFGHVPVPYSGDIDPDGHPEHYGAWPADEWYGALDDSDWTDTTVNDKQATNAANQNVPGDGKFDQSTPPKPIQLIVGRVDLSNMPSFSMSEEDLLRQYLHKDHAFRIKQLTAPARGLVDDNFGYHSGEAFASDGWMNLSTLLGPSNVQAGPFFPTLQQGSYLWAYGCGPGWTGGASGVGTTADFSANNPQAIFTMLFGSWLGDWNQQDDLLRAPLATSYGLTDVWAGRPYWYFHPMGLGEPIGTSVLLTQNNTSLYPPYTYGQNEIHIALMGDPTLRMQYVSPITNLSSTTSSNGVTLNWSASPDQVVGYNVYRASSPSGPFTRVTQTPITATTYTDTQPIPGSATYMIRAVQLTTSPTGSYFNPSEGVFTTVNTGLSIVDDQDTSITYSSGWSSSSSMSGYYLNTVHYSNTAGSTVQYTFNGTGVSWVGAANVDHGRADVAIDGTLDQTVDTYAAAWNKQQVLYEKTGLTPGQHTIKITVRSDANPASSGIYQDIDAFLVFNSALTANTAINAGGGAGGSFVADTDFSGGQTYQSGDTITIHAANAAPPAVYQSERYGTFSYTVSGLQPGAAYVARLHFAEIWWNNAGQRIFNVTINGNAALSNVDVFAIAGGKDIAVVKEVLATADSQGNVTIALAPTSNSPDQNAKVSGLEILS